MGPRLVNIQQETTMIRADEPWTFRLWRKNVSHSTTTLVPRYWVSVQKAPSVRSKEVRIGTQQSTSVRGVDDNFGGKTQKLHYGFSRYVGRERKMTLIWVHVSSTYSRKQPRYEQKDGQYVKQFKQYLETTNMSKLLEWRIYKQMNSGNACCHTVPPIWNRNYKLHTWFCLLLQLHKDAILGVSP